MILSYNGIFLPYSNCTQFQQEVMYDELSRTDWYLTKYNISVQAVINYNYLSLIAPDLLEDNEPLTKNAAEITAFIRQRLLAPRNQLSMTFNGVELIPQKQNTLVGTVDAKNGPQPQSCNITQLTSETFLIQYNIIAHYWESTQAGNAALAGSLIPIENFTGSSVISNRWTETIDIDNCNFTTRTREGKYIIRSDNAKGWVADKFREGFAVVGLPKGFLRLSSHYTVSPDGLGVAYKVVDRQVFKMPPAPAYEADGEFVESFPGYGSVRWGDFRIALKGSPTVSQTDLINTALGIASAKFIGVRKSYGNLTMIPVQTSLRVDSYSNSIELKIRQQYIADVGRISNVAAFAGGSLAFTPGSDGHSYQPSYPVRGTADRLLQAAAYFDPSLDLNELEINNNSQTKTGIEVGAAGKNLEK